MSEILVNETGVQTQVEAISSTVGITGQAAAEYILHSDAHQDELDGTARFDARQLSIYAHRAVYAAYVTALNMCSFVTNAAQDMSSTDRAQSGRFNPEIRRE